MIASIAAAAGVAGCGELPGDDDDDGGPLIQVDYGGTYDTGGTWDLSQPFGPDGVGGVVADLLIDRIVSLAGVPSSLEDDARAAVAGRIRASIVGHVNGRVPTEMLASSPTMMALDQILSAVRVDGELVLVAGGDPDLCSGTDVVDNLSVVHESVTYTIDVAEVSGGLTSIMAPVSGSATGAATIALADHDLQLHYGALVAAVARDALGVDVFALTAQAWANVSCPEVVDGFTGGGGFTVTVAGQDYTVTDARLEVACGELKAMLADHALGIFRRDAGVRLGGTVAFDGGGVASRSDYDGVITLFPIVQPQIVISFTGQR